jgi:hypothetical protein
MQRAAKKYRCTNHKKHPWSEQFRQATYYSRYWRKRMEIATLRRISDDTAIFYMIQAGYPHNTNHDAASEMQCQAVMRKEKSMMNTELERQKELVTSERRTFAESIVAKRHPTLSNNDDLSSNLHQENLVESQLKQMINKEDKKLLFLILRRDIKGAINLAIIIRYQWKGLTSHSKMEQ